MMPDPAEWDEAAEAAHVEWVRGICFFASAEHRGTELIERGMNRAQVVDALYPAVHGSPRAVSLAPWRDLFTGDWRLDDPDLIGVDLND